MSDLVIKDGTGKGYRTGVNATGRLLTEAKVLPQVSVETANGNQYTLPVGKRYISTVDTEHSFLYMNPNSPTKTFTPQRFVVSNSGTTPIFVRVYIGATVPTANHVAFAPGNSNTLSKKTAAMTAYQWNGVGTGMTHASKGVEAFSAYFAQGFSDVQLDGSQLWGLNAGVIGTIECSVATFCTLITTGWEGDYTP